MATRAGIISTSLLSLTFGLAGLTGCDIGSGVDEQEDPGPVGLQCEAQLVLSGTFAPEDGVGGGADPEDPDSGWSCIPLGTWTVNVEVADPGDCAAVNVQSQYVYTVTKDPEDARGDYITVYNEDPNAEFSSAKVTIEGPCIGNFQHFSADYKEITNLQPYVDTEASLSFAGSGVFETYDKPQSNGDQ